MTFDSMNWKWNDPQIHKLKCKIYLNKRATVARTNSDHVVDYKYYCLVDFRVTELSLFKFIEIFFPLKFVNVQFIITFFCINFW